MNRPTPIIKTDYPDPDIIRVEDTYYMISTTMHFMPGGVILRSFDLKNWEIAGYVYETLEDTPRREWREKAVSTARVCGRHACDIMEAVSMCCSVCRTVAAICTRQSEWKDPGPGKGWRAPTAISMMHPCCLTRMTESILLLDSQIFG